MKKANIYSANSGLPINNVVVPNLSGTLNLFDSLKNSGKVFRVDVRKRSDGTMRTMICKCGVVPKNPSGKKRTYDPASKGLLTVWEFGNGYRTINLDGITLIKHKGTVYVMNTTLAPGDYQKSLISHNLRGRTVKAITSPLYS